jgi:hemolysin III
MAHREFSRREELANSLTHGVGLVMSVVIFPVLVLGMAARHDALLVVGVSVFAATLVALYAASTIYHALPPSPAKQLFRVIDHAAIYLLIAGTYTPFTLGVLRGAWGWTMLGLIWTVAALGVVFKTTLGFRFPRLSTGLYVAMGWMVIIALKPMMTLMPHAGLAWLALGGLCYTGGVVFYVREHKKYNHALWHLFVLGGSVCHVVAVIGYS